MSRVCDICGKGPLYGNKVSHAHNTSRRRWLPNLQRVKANINGTVKRIRVCTSCLKNGKVVKAAQFFSDKKFFKGRVFLLSFSVLKSFNINAYSPSKIFTWLIRDQSYDYLIYFELRTDEKPTPPIPLTNMPGVIIYTLHTYCN